MIFENKAFIIIKAPPIGRRTFYLFNLSLNTKYHFEEFVFKTQILSHLDFHEPQKYLLLSAWPRHCSSFGLEDQLQKIQSWPSLQATQFFT